LRDGGPARQQAAEEDERSDAAASGALLGHAQGIPRQEEKRGRPGVRQKRAGVIEKRGAQSERGGDERRHARRQAPRETRDGQHGSEADGQKVQEEEERPGGSRGRRRQSQSEETVDRSRGERQTRSLVGVQAPARSRLVLVVAESRDRPVDREGPLL